MSAHHRYCAFGGDSCSCAAFGEHDRDGFGEEGIFDAGGYCAGFDGGFVGGAIADEGGEFLWG